MNIQIVGKVTDGGRLKETLGRNSFNEAAKYLRDKYPDAIVYNPVEQVFEDEDYDNPLLKWTVCMFHCYDNIIIEEPIIYLLSNWKESLGSRKEMALVKKLGLEVWHEQKKD